MRNQQIWTFLIFIFLVFGCEMLAGPADKVVRSNQPQTFSNYREFIDSFLIKLEKDARFSKDNFTHKETELTEKIRNGMVAEREIKTSLVEESSGKLYKKLLSINGIEIEGAEFKPKDEFVPMNRKFLGRYNYSFKRNDKINNQKCLVFSLKPRDGLTEERKEDRILNNLACEIWITPNLEFKRISFALISQVNYAWPGFSGVSVKRADGFVDAEYLEGGLVISKVFLEYEYFAKIIFFSRREHGRRTIEYTNYEKRRGK